MKPRSSPHSVVAAAADVATLSSSGPRRSNSSRRKVKAATLAAATVVSTSSPSYFASGSYATVSPSIHTPLKKKIKLEATSSPFFESPHSSPEDVTPIKKGTAQAFGAVTADNFVALRNKGIQVHTLILGTIPSIESMKQQQYYGHTMNAYWWMVGDFFGFRRRTAVSPSSNKPYKFASELRYDETHIIPYEQQLEILCSKGFAMWDVLEYCQRPGSLDVDIKNEVPADIRGLCKAHPSIRRIVLANGGTGSAFFKKHHASWFDTGEIVPSRHETSRKFFAKWAIDNNDDKKRGEEMKNTQQQQRQTIEVITALPVSPAAAKFSYVEKRAFWESEVFGPGLRDFEQQQQQAQNS